MMDGKEETVVVLSAYEQRRIANIKRNNALLRELGLITLLEERRSNANACGIDPKYAEKGIDGIHSDGPDDGDWKDATTCETMTKRKRKSKNTTPREGVRKSRRLKGEDVEITPANRHVVYSDDPIGRKKEREDRVLECREVRLRAANAIAACGGEEAAKKNPTATYEHCLVRVKTMTEKGLLKRVKMIERAAGKHCVVKMAIFKSCLQDEGLWELAEVAGNALERLKALKSVPEE